jgi:hypothetical protein
MDVSVHLLDPSTSYLWKQPSVTIGLELLTFCVTYKVEMSEPNELILVSQEGTLYEIHYVSLFQSSRNVTDSALRLSSGQVVVMFAERLLLLASTRRNTSLLSAHHKHYLLPVAVANPAALLVSQH